MCWTAVLSLCLASAASAQDVAAPTAPTTSHRWSEESGFTVGAGANVFAGAVGFPGLDLKLIHGLDATTDVNAHVGVNYAFEGVTRSPAWASRTSSDARRGLSVASRVSRCTYTPGRAYGPRRNRRGLSGPEMSSWPADWAHVAWPRLLTADDAGEDT